MPIESETALNENLPALYGKYNWYDLAAHEQNSLKKIQYCTEHLKHNDFSYYALDMRCKELIAFGEYDKAIVDANLLIQEHEKGMDKKGLAYLG